MKSSTKHLQKIALDIKEISMRFMTRQIGQFSQIHAVKMRPMSATTLILSAIKTLESISHRAKDQSSRITPTREDTIVEEMDTQVEGVVIELHQDSQLPLLLREAKVEIQDPTRLTLKTQLLPATKSRI